MYQWCICVGIFENYGWVLYKEYGTYLSIHLYGGSKGWNARINEGEMGSDVVVYVLFWRGHWQFHCL
jgi:hypothetical protein